MSNEVLNWAKKVTVGGQTRKAVFLLLADYADDKGRAWPSQGTIADTLEMSERTVRTAVKELVEAGLLTRKTRWRPDGTRGTDVLKFDMDLVNRQELPAMAALPANDAKTTGKSRQINRQMAPNQPAGDAANPLQGEPPEGIPQKQNGSEANASGSTALAVLPAAFPMDDLSPIDQLWFEGKVILAEMGQQPRTSGSLIGGWIKRYHDPVRILGAMRFARSSGTQDPIPLIVATLEGPDGRQRASPAGKRGFFAAELARDLSKEWVQ